jgi:hypothetical protein
LRQQASETDYALLRILDPDAENYQRHSDCGVGIRLIDLSVFTLHHESGMFYRKRQKNSAETNSALDSYSQINLKSV